MHEEEARVSGIGVMPYRLRGTVVRYIMATAVLAFTVQCSGKDQTTNPVDDSPLNFESSPVYMVGYDIRSVQLADMDQDNDLDVVAVGLGRDTSSVYVLLNSGSRSFVTSSRLLVSHYANDAVVADIDGDVDLDIAIAAEPCMLLLNNGNGEFSGDELPTAGWFIDAGDLDKDGDVDIVVGAHTPVEWPLTILINEGGASFGPTANYRTNGDSPTNVVVLDFESGGRPDIAVCNANGANMELFLFGGYGSGWYTTPRTFPAGIYPYSILASDLDSDSSVDIVVGNLDSDDISVYLNRSPGGAVDSPLSYPAGGYPRSIAVGDLDEDGHPDIVTSVDNEVIALLNDGGAAFDSLLTLDAGIGEIRAVATADLDGDQRSEIVVADRNGKLVILYGKQDQLEQRSGHGCKSSSTTAISASGVAIGTPK